ncbi:MAG TPA: hypothetical protein PKO15_09780 [Fibrobacteria bacterium]|nr:hypothetical protein [Fibrobacteria bacterium]HOX51508.1 hypothetical protein [Fibrobacteria bacterium]
MNRNGKSRHVALWVPGLSLQLLEAQKPELRGRAWALASQAGGAQARLDDSSPRARELGVLPGMRLAELRRRFPTLPVHAPQASGLGAFRRILSSLCDARTPVWELSADGAMLDLTGTEHLFGGDWDLWARRLRADLEAACGIRDVHLVVSHHRMVAEILARSGEGSQGVSIVEAGAEFAHLGGVSLDAVPWISRATRERLSKYGISTLDDVRRQARSFLKLHLGADGERLSALAMGIDPEPSHRNKAPSADMVLSRDENDREVVRAAVHQLADRLAFALREKSLGGREISLRLGWSDGQEMSSFARPLGAVEDFLALRDVAWKLLDQLDVRRVSVRSLRLSATRTQASTGQVDLFASPDVQRQRDLGMALDRVRRRQGFSAVENALVSLAV